VNTQNNYLRNNKDFHDNYMLKNKTFLGSKDKSGTYLREKERDKIRQKSSQIISNSHHLEKEDSRDLTGI
jgi:hypothetical protein